MVEMRWGRWHMRPATAAVGRHGAREDSRVADIEEEDSTVRGTNHLLTSRFCDVATYILRCFR